MIADNEWEKIMQGGVSKSYLFGTINEDERKKLEQSIITPVDELFMNWDTADRLRR